MTGGGGEGGWGKEDKMISEICVEYRNTLRMRAYNPNGDKQLVTFPVEIVHHVSVNFSWVLQPVNHLNDFPFRVLFRDQFQLRRKSSQCSPAGLLW